MHCDRRLNTIRLVWATEHFADVRWQSRSMAGRRLLACGFFALLIALLPRPAWACSCSGFATFEEVTREPGMIVLVGRVVAVGADRNESVSPKDPRHIDVDVTWVARGRASSTRVRVWNLWAGTSCGGSLTDLVAGDTAIVAVSPAAQARRDSTELWEALDLQIPPVDYVITTSCGQAVRALRTREAIEKYVGRVIP